MKNITKGIWYILIGTMLYFIGLAIAFEDIIIFGSILIAFAGAFIIPGFAFLFNNESKQSESYDSAKSKSNAKQTEYKRSDNPVGDIYITIDGTRHVVTASSLCISYYVQDAANNKKIKNGDVFIFEGKRYAKKNDKIYLIEKTEIVLKERSFKKTEIIYKIQEIVLQFEEELPKELNSCLPIILKMCSKSISENISLSEDGIYALIMNLCYDLIASGEYHIYAGQINPLQEGVALYEVCKNCAIWLVNNDYMTGKEYIAFCDNLDYVILCTG